MLCCLFLFLNWLIYVFFQNVVLGSSERSTLSGGSKSNIAEGCNVQDSCSLDPCSHGQCVDEWGKHSCQCSEGKKSYISQFLLKVGTSGLFISSSIYNCSRNIKLFFLSLFKCLMENILVSLLIQKQMVNESNILVQNYKRIVSPIRVV